MHSRTSQGELETSGTRSRRRKPARQQPTPDLREPVQGTTIGLQHSVIGFEDLNAASVDDVATFQDISRRKRVLSIVGDVDTRNDGAGREVPRVIARHPIKKRPDIPSRRTGRAEQHARGRTGAASPASTSTTRPPRRPRQRAARRLSACSRMAELRFY